MSETREEYLARGFAFIRELRSREILQEVVPESFRGVDKGAILIICGDGDRFSEGFSHLNAMTERIHTIALNGGPILLAKGPMRMRLRDLVSRLTFGLLYSQYAYSNRRKIILQDCLDAHKLKGCHLIKTMGHFSCGKALMWGLNAKEIILATLESKQVLRGALGKHIVDLHVGPFFHVDWRNSSTPGKGCKTYFVQLGSYDEIAKIPY